MAITSTSTTNRTSELVSCVQVKKGLGYSGSNTLGGFGHQFFSHGGADQIIGPNRQRIQVDGLGAGSLNNLKAPFDGSILVNNDGGNGVIFLPRASGDDYTLVLRLTIVPDVINTDVFAELDIGGSFQVIETEPESLLKGAGEPHSITFIFRVFAGSTFVSNGGQFWITSSNAATITKADLRVFPESIQ